MNILASNFFKLLVIKNVDPDLHKYGTTWHCNTYVQTFMYTFVAVYKKIEKNIFPVEKERKKERKGHQIHQSAAQKSRARIFKLLRSPRILFQGINFSSLCSLAGRYDNPIPTRFLGLQRLFKNSSTG